MGSLRTVRSAIRLAGDIIDLKDRKKDSLKLESPKGVSPEEQRKNRDRHRTENNKALLEPPADMGKLTTLQDKMQTRESEFWDYALTLNLTDDQRKQLHKHISELRLSTYDYGRFLGQIGVKQQEQ